VSASHSKVLTLNPGEFAFAEGEAVLQTVLGSCVAITFWNPRRSFGAMCHYILPDRPANSVGKEAGCYADETLGAIAQRFRNLGIQPGDLEVRMFGGGNMFPNLPPSNLPLIGDRNIEAGRLLLETYGFTLTQMDLAGEVHRKVTFELRSGRVHLEHGHKQGPTQKVQK